MFLEIKPTVLHGYFPEPRADLTMTVTRSVRDRGCLRVPCKCVVAERLPVYHGESGAVV